MDCGKWDTERAELKGHRWPEERYGAETELMICDRDQGQWRLGEKAESMQEAER